MRYGFCLWTPIVIAVCWLLGGFTAAQNDPPRDDGHRATLRAVRSAVAQEHSSARNRLRVVRPETIEVLLELVRTEAPPQHSEFEIPHATELLGEYRAAQAADLLVERIDYSPPLLRVRNHPLYRYPSAKALVSIGSASFPAIKGRLLHPMTDRQVSILAWVIKLIDGEEIGLYRLQHTLAETPALLEERRKNLTRLIEIYRRMDFSNPIGPE